MHLFTYLKRTYFLLLLQTKIIVMKKILAFIMLGAFAACNSGSNTEVASMKSETDSAKKPDVIYPYTTDYSSQFSIGDGENAKKILEIWKDWDNGNLSMHKDYFADTVDLHFADGTILHGARDSVMAAVQAFRDTYKSVTSQVHAVTPLKSNDKDEDWVCVWGKEIHTDNKGVTDSVELMETWRLNKNGKTDLVYQYNAKSAPMPAKK
jgi:hypothetical protein